MTGPEPSAAELAKSFFASQKTGLLSTISKSQDGYPFGSIAPYDVNPCGQVFIYISLIAEHYKNLIADSRASLMAVDTFGSFDPQAHARATLLLDFTKVPDSERELVQASYEARFPNSVDYNLAHNFVFMCGTPKKLRWIGGFGDIRWIQGEDFTQAVCDPLAYASGEIISHMNKDHRDALVSFVEAYAQKQLSESEVLMTEISSREFVITTHPNSALETASSKIRIPFPRILQQASEARTEIIKLLKTARERISRSGLKSALKNHTR